MKTILIFAAGLVGLLFASVVAGAIVFYVDRLVKRVNAWLDERTEL